jgi:hypothetical protein
VKEVYDRGGNAYFTKPHRLQEMIDTIALINHFWAVAERPPVHAMHVCV